MKRRISPAAVLALVVAGSSGVWAGTPTAELQAFLATTSRILEDSEADGKYEEHLAAIRALTRDLFDAREGARLALGPEWNQLTPGQQDEFAWLYGDLVERAFMSAVASRAQIAGGIKVTFLGQSVDGDRATVRTTVLSRGGHELPFDYRLIARDDRWAVRDVVVDGVSMAANYRAQFARIMQASSYAELVRQLRDKGSAPMTMAAAGRDADLLLVSPAPPLPSASQGERVADVPAPGQDFPGGEAARIRSAGRSGSKLSTRAAESRPGSSRSGPMAARRSPSLDANARLYWVQVAAFKSVQSAMRLASALRDERPPVSARWAVVMASAPASPPLARVRVGPFQDRLEAASSIRDLQARGFKPFIAEDGD